MKDCPKENAMRREGKQVPHKGSGLLGNSHLERYSEFGKFSPGFVGSYEIFSGVGKVDCELELLNEWHWCVRFSMSLSYRRVLGI
uniref:Uncharacterized protein n=1 Tax=Solanum tuberosum TaxID=4113 RepID=M1DZ08_SOLTU